MSQIKLSNIQLSAEEYFALDTENQDRYEYENGCVWSMAGTSTNHNRIVLNLALLFRADIKNKKRKCEIFTENIWLEVLPKRIYYYPDLIFTCNPTDLQDKIMMHSPWLLKFYQTVHFSRIHSIKWIITSKCLPYYIM